MPKVRPKKSLGQHFLTDIPTVERIAATVDALPDLPILEVGPEWGFSHLRFWHAKGS